MNTTDVINGKALILEEDLEAGDITQLQYDEGMILLAKEKAESKYNKPFDQLTPDEKEEFQKEYLREVKGFDI